MSTLPKTKKVCWFFVLLLLLSCGSLFAAESATGPHIRVSLISEDAALVPGRTHFIGVLLEPEPHWHTYWRNPGDSGEPPKVSWKLPEGVDAGELQWPVPEQISVAHLVNYGYEGPVLLMAPLTIGAGFSGKQVNIEADLSWLVCREDCIPGWATLDIALPVSGNADKSRNTETFATTRDRLPEKETLSGSYEITAQHINLRYLPPYETDWSLLPLDAGIIQHNQPQSNHLIDGQLTQTLKLSEYFEADGQPLQFLLTDGQQGYYLTSTPNMAGGEKAESPGQVPSLFLLALMAFAGGLILNLMPCVLPILCIKALSLQHDTGASINKLAFPLGVLLSFNVFAVSILLLKQGGEAVGWGFHMQEPWVVALLAFLFVFIALQLMDIAPSGEGLMGLGSKLTTGNGFSSQFFTGVLAVLVASPCTAPFMAAALGVALVSDALVSFTLFTSLAVGFALPMTILFWLPAVRRLLPKPGSWMQTFRQFLVFPILATVVWLLWVYQSQAGSAAQFVLLASLLLFSLLLWLSALLGDIKSKLALLFALLSMVPALQQQPLSPDLENNSSRKLVFNEDRLQQLRDDNQVVLVNMTADWCITCKVNEQVALGSEELNTLFSEQNVHYMVGDWTNKNKRILHFLNRYQRSGVPLYVVYAGNTYEQVLPQLLTPQTVINAINTAKKELSYENEK